MEHGVSPNLQRGKTEILFAPKGTGSRERRRRYFSTQCGQQIQIVHERGCSSISVVGSYVHLGGKLHHTGETRAEARRRVAIAPEAFERHRRQLFQNMDIPLQRRRELFMTLVMSKLCFGFESWTFSQQSMVDYVHGAIIRLYKRLLKIPANQHMDDYEVLALAELPSPVTVFRSHRLRYLLTLCNCEDSTSWGLLVADRHWQHMIIDDLAWLWSKVSNTCTLQDPADHPREWIYILRHHKKYWKTLVRRATTLDVLQNKDLWQLRQIHGQVFAQLTTTGHLGLARPSPPSPPVTGHFGCMLCKRRCKTKAGEAAHMFRCHRFVAEFRTYSDTTACPACLREYHTMDRLHAHFRRSTQCCEQQRGRGIAATITPGIGSRFNSQLKLAHDGLLPYQEAEGPSNVPRPAIDPMDFNLELFEEIALYIFEHGSGHPASLQRHLQQLIGATAISWTFLRRTLDRLSAEFDATNCDLAGANLEELQAVLARLRDPLHWPFLNDAIGEPTAGHCVESLNTYEVWCETLACDESSPTWTSTSSSPPKVFAERIILHAYSGRRREGDFQWFIEDRAHQLPGVSIYVVSLGIVIDSAHGNIGRADVRETWYVSMRNGYVIGFLSGPPCCTWSKARGKTLCGELPGRGPRALRSAQCLWGFESVSIKEMLQLMDGHLLLGFSATSMCILATTQGAALLEPQQSLRSWSFHQYGDCPSSRCWVVCQECSSTPCRKVSLGQTAPNLRACLH